MGCPQVLLELSPPQLSLSSTAWEWGRRFYCSELPVSMWTPPPPSSSAQQDTVPPDDWESSHNHSPCSRSWHTAAQWIKQVVDIVCWAMRTGVSQSRDQDKVGVELLSALISNNAAGYEFWTQIYHCVWHCVWPTAGIWLLLELKEKVFITSWRWRQCFDVKYGASLLWKYTSFRSVRRVNKVAVRVNMFWTFDSHRLCLHAHNNPGYMRCTSSLQ